MRHWLPILVLAACASESPAPDPSTIELGGGKADGGASIGGPFACPDGARFATNGEDEMFCLFEGISAPADAQAYCDYLDHDVIGFDWPLASAPDYACPADSRQTTNGQSLGFCLYDVPATPAQTQPYCNYLASNGTIGYEWSLCPAGGRVAGNGQGTEFCIFEQLPMPHGSRAYCDYVELGYVGFYYPEDNGADFTCPEPFVGATNGAGLGFCLLEDLAIPRDLDVQPYCDADRGYVGFYWPANG